MTKHLTDAEVQAMLERVEAAMPAAASGTAQLALGAGMPEEPGCTNRLPVLPYRT